MLGGNPLKFWKKVPKKMKKIFLCIFCFKTLYNVKIDPRVKNYVFNFPVNQHQKNWLRKSYHLISYVIMQRTRYSRIEFVHSINYSSTFLLKKIIFFQDYSKLYYQKIYKIRKKREIFRIFPFIHFLKSLSHRTARTNLKLL